LKPIIKYCGGKSREIKYFAKYFPDDFDTYSGTYYEPFLGGGAVFFGFMPKNAFLSDSNRQLMNFYKDFSKHYQRIRNELKCLEAEYRVNQMEYELEKKINPEERVVNRNENRYYLLRSAMNGHRYCDYSSAAIYYYINRLAYAGLTRFNSKGEFNAPFGHYKKFSIENADLAHAQLLQQAELKCCKYKYAFERACGADSTKNFMFLDPPYDGVFSNYGTPFGEKEHRELAQDFRNLSCKALMVLGKTPLTESLYKDFIRGEYGVKYAIDIKNRMPRNNGHLIITNYS
jgi:DNA adenine methylase